MSASGPVGRATSLLIGLSFSSGADGLSTRPLGRGRATTGRAVGPGAGLSRRRAVFVAVIWVRGLHDPPHPVVAGHHGAVTHERLRAELVAVVTAVTDGRTLVLTADAGQRLPPGSPRTGHRPSHVGLLAWAERQTWPRLGYVEQLYTFADPDRSGEGGRVVSVSYLGLTRTSSSDPPCCDWYAYFPWEDHSPGAEGPRIVLEQIVPALEAWAARGADRGDCERRALRAAG